MKEFLKKINSLSFRSYAVFAFLILSFWPTSLWSQSPADQPVSQPLLIIFALVGLSLLPFLVIMVSSFVKVAVVMGLIRSALGTQQIPPNQIITGLAMVLTIYIMAPVGIETYRAIESTVKTQSNQGILSQATFGLMEEAYEKGREPLRGFLVKNAHPSKRQLFYEIAVSLQKPQDRDKIGKRDFLVLTPAFIVSELSEAFQIGFVIFLPFLVIDMVVANILLSLGMFQLSPITVSLPFKLLLFVLVDGWTLITKGLVLGYA